MNAFGPDRVRSIQAALAAALHPDAVVAREGAVELHICAGTGCHASGREAVVAALRDELGLRGLAGRVRVVETGCHGLCEEGPIVVAQPAGLFFSRVNATDAAIIIDASAVGSGVHEGSPYKDPHTGRPVPLQRDLPFFAEQRRVILALNGKIDPRSIDDYLDRGGYAALGTVLADGDPDGRIGVVAGCGLWNRDAAAAVTGADGDRVSESGATETCVVCDAGAGDGKAFADRSMLEGNPHGVVEGMIIAGCVLGATRGSIYLSAGHRLAAQSLERALVQARERGILGPEVLNSGFSFEIDIVKAAGPLIHRRRSEWAALAEDGYDRSLAFSTLIAREALLGNQAIVHGVEVYATLPSLVGGASGGAVATGDSTSAGTMILALTGKVAHGGLAEVPREATLRDVIFAVGGGVPEGHELKAVQLGRHVVGCLPDDVLDEPIDDGRFAPLGNGHGWSGLVVLDDTACMVDLARYFMELAVDESCGACVPCRLGAKRMLEILDRICDGGSRKGDLELLEELARSIVDGALCESGGEALTPVLDTLKEFRHEYEAHITDKRCPAGFCRALAAAPSLEEQS